MNIMITLTLMKLIKQDDEYNEKKLIFWVICNVVGAKTWAFALGLKSHSLIIMRPRRRKHGKGPIINSRADKYPRMLIREGHPPRIWHMSVKWTSSYLRHLPGSSINEDRFQMYREGIRTQKYLRKKLLPPH